MKEFIPDFDEFGTAYTPDFIAEEHDARKARAWRFVEHEHDEKIYVSYGVDDRPDYRRGFTLNALQAVDLVEDINKALDKIFGPCECESASEEIA